MDASVIAAWCFQELRKQEAGDVITASDLYAPTILAYELANIACQKTRKHPDAEGNVRQGLEAALGLPIHWQAVDHMSVLGVALDSNLTTYDASYLYLSRLMNLTLVTFDERLRRAARGA